jgi:MauM/NapG family ferredoxin protein
MSLSRRTFLKTSGVLAVSAAGGWTLRRAARGTPLLLRPPGARTARDFFARCIRCLQCVQACPTDVLRPADAACGVAFGTPHLVARETPCDLCQGRAEMECIAACPTGALQPLANRRDVRMGVAVIDPETCLPFVGVSCKACWHACPFPGDAISFDGLGRPLVVENVCVGCGLCEYACLTPAASIRVVPAPHGLAEARSGDETAGLGSPETTDRPSRDT